MNKENLYLTAKENLDSTLGSVNNGVVVSVCSTTLSNNNDGEIWIAKPIEWINPQESSFRSHSEVEAALEKTGIFIATSFLLNGTYAISISERTSTAEATVAAIVDALEYNTDFNPIILD